MLSRLLLLFFSVLFFCCQSQGESKQITIGSKRFTENYIVAEIMAQHLENHSYQVNRKFGMGGTMVAYRALQSKEIDLYPEYTGTISQAILKKPKLNFQEMEEGLKQNNILMLKPLGFDNSYCLVIRSETALKKGIQTISDLSKHPELSGALSFEFQERSDGWKVLRKIYSLKNQIRGIEIPLTYQALHKKKVDFAEAYTTEPLIAKYNFEILQDDKRFFPKYRALPLVHNQVSEEVKDILDQLENTLDNKTITQLNSQATNGKSVSEVARSFLLSAQLVHDQKDQKPTITSPIKKTLQRTKTHLFLTGLAVLLATLVAVPFASVFAGHKKISNLTLNIAGILQTIPSIALLAFMIPLFGIGFKPAIIVLFIYSLLPILRNTHTAMNSIDPRIITAARGIGLYPVEIFFSIKLPLALPMILAGVRTATTLNIGTATLAAFIGAGGLGEPIVTGLALNDSRIILQGAIPAALLAIVIDGSFALIDRFFTKAI